MDLALDIYGAQPFELFFENGDFLLLEAENVNEQNKTVLLLAKGTFKDYPFLCADSLKYLNSDNSNRDLRAAIKEAAKLDNATASNIVLNLEDGEINFNLVYA